MLDTRILDDPRVKALIASLLPPDDGNVYVTIHIPYDTAVELAKYENCYAPLLKQVAELCADELS